VTDRRTIGRNARIAMAIGLATVLCVGLWGVGLVKVPDKRQQVPELVFEKENGQTLRLSDLRGRTILLNLWATWCVSCRTEMPTLARLNRRLGSSQFEVVALSVDRDGLEVVKPFFAEVGITDLTIYLNPTGDSIRLFKVTGLPTTVLIGRDGTELRRWIGPKDWDSPEVVAEISQLAALPAGAGNNAP